MRYLNMTYCITKFKKIKSNSEITEYAGHNMRTKISVSRNENIDIDLIKNNRRIVNKFNVSKAPDLQKKINEYYDSLGIKVKKDNVLGIDFICTTSPEYWGDWKSQIGTPAFELKLKEWQTIQMTQIGKEFGKDSIAYAELHLDETTPHIHIYIMPIDQKEVTFKNRHGTSVKTKNILNANKYDPAFFKGLVTRFGKANEPLGLQRGRIDADVDPKPLKEFRQELKKQEAELKKLRPAYIQAINGAAAQAKVIKELSRENEQLTRQNNMLKAKIEQIDAHKTGIISDNTLESLGL